MRTALLIAMAALALAACDDVKPRVTYLDQCARAKLFEECMNRIPKGPEHITATSNRWNDTIEACNDSAREMSFRDDPTTITTGCRKLW